jgi:hypothetical protein
MPKHGFNDVLMDCVVMDAISLHSEKKKRKKDIKILLKQKR